MIIQIEPWIDDRELTYLQKVIDSTFVTEHELTKQFEERIRNLTGSKHAIAMMNGTVALYSCLKVIGISPGDEVIVPNLTFVATANAVIMAGATPVFCDVSNESMCIEVKQIEKLITSRTKCIMPVHLFGNSSNMNEICEFAQQHNIEVIEDAAQGVGVRFKNKHVGTFGDLGVLSFYGNKTITCGEGGVVLTDNDELAKACYRLKNHGRSKKGVFVHETIGFNFCFTEMQAAIGLAQLDKLQTIICQKERIFKRYYKAFEDCNSICPPILNPKMTQVWWMSYFFFENKDKLEEYLAKDNIQTRKFFYPLHLQPCYEYMSHLYGKNTFENSTSLYENGLCLPSSVLMSDEDQEKVIEAVLSFYRGEV